MSAEPYTNKKLLEAFEQLDRAIQQFAKAVEEETVPALAKIADSFAAITITVQLLDSAAVKAEQRKKRIWLYISVALWMLGCFAVGIAILMLMGVL